MEKDMWVAKEFSFLEFGDKRILSRFQQVMGSLSARPGSPMTEACQDWAAVKGGDRLISNEQFQSALVFNAHREETIRRAQDSKIVLAIQDTTSLNFDGHQRTQGLGHIGTHGKTDSKGLLVHTQFLLTPTGVPLGVTGQKIWARKKKKLRSPTQGRARNRSKPIEEKETYKWIEFLEASWLADLRARVIHIGDREVDIYEFIEKANHLQKSFVIRAAWNRSIIGTYESLWSRLKAATVFYSTSVLLDQEIRNVDVRIDCVEIKAPRGHCFVKKDETQKVWAIYVTEKTSNPDRLEWMLLTNIPIQTKKEVQEKINWYKLRWKIEVFHKILKTGCRVEKLRFSTAEKLKKMITLLSILAWRIFFLTTLHQSHPQATCDTILTQAQWKSLYCAHFKTDRPPDHPPCVKDALIWIAQLGGFMARTHDNLPGFITLWRGWHTLHTMALLWTSLHPTTCG